MKLKKLIFTKNYTWKKAYNLFLAKVQWKIFKKVMDECGPYLWELDLFNWGEPFLNRQLFEMVRYSKI